MATTKGIYTTNRTYVALLRGTYAYVQTYITDPFFSYNSLLLSGDTTAIPFNADASTNKFDVTVFGDTKAANFNPYTPGYYSNSFDASSPVLIAASSTAYSFGTGDFLIETYGYARSWPSTWRIFSSPNATILDLFGGNNGSLQYNSGAGGTDATTTLLLNQWFHLAITRQSGVLRIFLDGVLKYTIANSNNYTTATEGYIGGYAGYSQSWDGFLSNFRVIKGAFPSLYQTSSVTVGATIFTVPTAPLTAVTNTSFLTCQENRFVDNSPNDSAITRNGDVSIKSFNPFLAPSAVAVNNFYSTNFDGSGDYLNTPSNAAFGFGTGDFTIEGWFYFTGTIGTYQRPWWFGDDNDNIEINSSVLRVGGASQGTLITGSTTILAHTWYHIALVRANGIYRLWLNGTQEGSTATNSYNSSARTFTLMATSSGVQPSAGTVSNLRVVKGTALYTGTFTPPTAPLTAITNTSLLTCQSSTLIDNSTNNFAITSFGQAQPIPVSPFTQTTTAVNTTYLGSGYFDGTGDWLTTASASTSFNLGAGDFTIECWVYPTSAEFQYGKNLIGNTQDGTVNGWALSIQRSIGTHGIFLGLNNAIVISSGATTVTVNAWNHIAVVRSGAGSDNLKIYLNGVSVATATLSTNDTTNTAMSIGGDDSAAPYNLVGYLSNARFVRGTAIYKSNFAPPLTPLTAVTNTSLLTLQNSQPHNNNTFLDSSSNKFLITRNGNSTQGTFSPYGGNWSNYFDGTGDYLTAPSTDVFAFGTGAYTIEAWVYVTSRSLEASIWATGAQNNNFLITTGGLLRLYNGTSYTGTTVIPLNTWAHVAVVRTSTASNGTQLFVNGVSDLVFTDTTNQTSATTGVIGVNGTGGEQYFFGSISNLRVVKGTAIYTANFTPPTAPLTAISGTSLLTCADNRLIDESPNNFTITKTGDVSVQRFSPFNPSSLTPTSYSGYFDGTGDYLTVPDNIALQFGTGAFTMELWFYPTATISSQLLLAKGTGGDGFEFRSRSSGGGNYFSFWAANGAAAIVEANVTLTLNTWQHLAVVRSSGTMTLYKNGVNVGSASDSTNFVASGSALRVAVDVTVGNLYSTGYISNVRIVKGVAVYTGAFTVPTSPLTSTQSSGTNIAAITGTSTSLLTLQSTTFIDNSTNNFTITAFGNSKPTTVNPFGFTNTASIYSPSTFGGSAYFDGNGDYIKTNTTTAFGASNYTIECWVYHIGTPNPCWLWDGLTDSGTGPQIFTTTSGTTLNFYKDGSTQIINASVTLKLNQWTHYAFCRVGTTTTAYVNGVSVGSGTDNTNSTTPIRGGFGSRSRDGAESNQAYFGDFRIVVGTAVYTSNFVPPLQPLTAVANTSLLLNFTDAAVTDSSMMVNLESLGDAKITTANSRIGGSAMFFDGTDDYLSIPSSTSLNCGTGNFTFECWVYISSRTLNYPAIFSNNNGSYSAGAIALTNSNADNGAYVDRFVLAVYDIATPTLVASSTNSLNTWYHLALVRNGTSLVMYRDGISVASTTISAAAIFDWGKLGCRIGGGNWDGNQSYFNGYIDDLRVTKYARYTSNFTPINSSHPLR